jgi:hypothetical protein
MATAKNAKPASGQGSNNRGGSDSYYIPPPPVPSSATNEDSEMGFLIALICMVVVFALLLPLIGSMYLDILEAKKEINRQQEQVQRMINQVKKEKEEK